MTKGARMEENGTERDELELGGSPQGDELAGDQPTSDDEGEPLEGSDNGDELEGDDTPDELEGDETGDDHPPLARARQQAARYRRQLRETEAALWAERVAALGVLADPEDLEFDADALHDPDRLRELADELVTRKPHLRSRRIRQRAGQGIGDSDGGVNLAAILARGA